MRNIVLIFSLTFFTPILSSGQFVPYTLSADFSGVDGAEIGDLDGDGDRDIVFDYQGVSIYENLDISQNEWMYHKIGGVGGKLLIEDVDQDDDLDVVAWHRERLVFYENINPSNLEFTYHETFEFSSENIRRSELIDIDGDGDLDFVNDKMTWAENVDGLFNFSGENPIYTIPEDHTVSFDMNFLDYDGDLDIDIVLNLEVARHVNQIKLLENVGSGSFASPVILVDSFPSWSLAFTKVIDVDNDDDFDFVVHNGPEDIGWFRNETDVFSDFIFIHEYFDVPADLEVIDIDGDGLLDIAWCGHGGVFWKINQGGFSFPKEAERLGPDEANRATVEITFGDLDQDGDLDLIRMGTSIGSFEQEFRWYENIYPPIVSTHEYTEHAVEIFPNPFEERLNLAGEYEYAELYDLHGRLVGYQTGHYLETRHVNQGSYVLKVFFEDKGYQAYKLIKL